MTIRCGVAVQQVVDARHVALRVVGGHDAQGVRHLNARYDGKSLTSTTIVEGLHSRHLHRLILSHLLSADMTCEGSSQRSDESDDGGYLDALMSQLKFATLHEIPTRDGHHENSSNDPC